jgi:PKHD-type hydroxylase
MAGMFAQVQGVLEPAEIAELTARLATAPFVDGRTTSTGRAAQGKRNLQMQPDAPGADELRSIVVNALQRSERFRRIAIPRAIAAPVFNRYDAGMLYEQHVDAATMRGGDGLRVDVSMTLFLSDPKSYEGGELVVETLSGGIGVKLAAGDAVVYPASTLHRVAPVRSGTRLAAITWIRSVVRDAAQRELLAELELAMTSLESRAPDARSEIDLLRKTHHNLIRMWAD